jgi:hypothetical protein
MATRRMGPGLDETEPGEAEPDEAEPGEAEPDEAGLDGAMLDMQVSFVGFAAL